MNLASRLFLALALLAGAAAPAAAGEAIPIHGTVLDVPSHGTAIVSVDAVPAMYPAGTRRFAVRGAALHAGEAIDAYLDPSGRTLEDVNAGPRFVPGLPNSLITHVVARGDTLPDYRFEQQDGRTVRFADFRGKVLLLSFIYTRCPDEQICPAISGKFAYLQHHLDAARFHLMTLTLDPRFDSPAILATYARRYAANPARWSLATGEPSQVKDVLDSFGLAPLETTPGRIIHGDTLVMLGADGKVADLIPTSGWEPDDVIATAENIAGSSSNPLRRFELATIAGVIAFCGGSISTGLVVLDSAVFILGVAILGGLLIWITKRIIIDERL